MNFELFSEFDEKAKRLKHELKVKSDKDLAKFFNFNTSTFSERRKRNNFPDTQLRQIVASNPEYSYIDVDWVLTGKTRTEIALMLRPPMDNAQFTEEFKIAGTRLATLSSNEQQLIFDLIEMMYVRAKESENATKDTDQAE